MKNNYRFTGIRLFRFLGLALFFLGLTGTTCIEERIVEVVVGGELIAEFDATGQVNVFDDAESILIDDQVNLDEILQENGIESIQDVSVQSAFFRVTQKDPTPGRTISGAVTVGRDGNPESELIHYSSVMVNDDAHIDWTPVPLEQAGVDVLNSILDELVTGASNLAVTFHSSGTSTPLNVESNFRYEVKVRFNVVGLVKVDVVDGI
jgi:hypothetical protein